MLSQGWLGVQGNVNMQIVWKKYCEQLNACIFWYKHDTVYYVSTLTGVCQYQPSKHV